MIDIHKKLTPYITLKNGAKLFLNQIKRKDFGELSLRKFSHGFDISNRTAIINHLINFYSYESYLEIGVRDLRNFDKIICKNKIGIDPSPSKFNKNIYIQSSDNFFSELNKNNKFDIIFIDGLHLEDQVDRDIKNSLNHITNNGKIIMHDCNPPTSFHQRENYEVDGKFPPWNGTTWRSFIKNRMKNKNIEMCVVDCDWGVGIIKKGKQNLLEFEKKFSYSYLEKNRMNALNLISVDDFLNKYNK